jgi:radical SAM protein with 4Fe4S-binding SPASM domain
LSYFLGGPASLPCIWQSNCTDEFLSIDARGNVAQCDCWVTSYPDHFFGNVFEHDSLTALLETSRPRDRFLERPAAIVDQGCIDCDYLALCHGGCPVRTFTVLGTLLAKDPYCGLYKALFARTREVATTIARGRSGVVIPLASGAVSDRGNGCCSSRARATDPPLVRITRGLSERHDEWTSRPRATA